MVWSVKISANFSVDAVILGNDVDDDAVDAVFLTSRGDFEGTPPAVSVLESEEVAQSESLSVGP